MILNQHCVPVKSLFKVLSAYCALKVIKTPCLFLSPPVQQTLHLSAHLNFFYPYMKSLFVRNELHKKVWWFYTSPNSKSCVRFFLLIFVSLPFNSSFFLSSLVWSTIFDSRRDAFRWLWKPLRVNMMCLHQLWQSPCQHLPPATAPAPKLESRNCAKNVSGGSRLWKG